MPRCPLCDIDVKAESFLLSYVFDFYRHGYRQEYKLYHCGGCDLEFWNPIKFSQEFYDGYLPQDEILSLGFRNLPPYCKLFFDHAPVKSGRLLDVGCGDGVFLEEAKKRGYEVWGLDSDEKCKEAARTWRRLENVYRMEPEAFREVAEREKVAFDVISFFETLEHQEDPRGFLRSIKPLLKSSSSYIVGSVPNRERAFTWLEQRPRRVRGIAGDAVIGDFPPPHLTWWSQKALDRLFRNEGFTDIKFYPVGFNTVKEFSLWWENLLLGSLLHRSSANIKAMLVKGRRNSALSLEALEKSGARGPFKLLRALKSLRGLVFLPLAVLTLAYFNKNGYQIYFQARLSKVTEK